MNRYNLLKTKEVAVLIALCITLAILTVLTVLCLTATSAFAQRTDLYSRSIGLEFVMMPSQKVSLRLNNGSATDTVYSGYTDAKGKLSIALDERRKEYAGIACLRVAQEDISFILSEEFLLLYSTAKTVNADNIVYGNSVENVLLQSMLKGQKTWLNDAQAGIRMYALEYINLLDFLDKSATEQKQVISDYLVHRMDMEVLYTSGLWKQILDCIIQIYTEDNSLQKAFSRDMQSLGKRTASPAAYRAFTDFLETYLRENKIQDKGLRDLVDSMKKDRRYGRKDRAESKDTALNTILDRLTN